MIGHRPRTLLWTDRNTRNPARAQRCSGVVGACCARDSPPYAHAQVVSDRPIRSALCRRHCRIPDADARLLLAGVTPLGRGACSRARAVGYPLMKLLRPSSAAPPETMTMTSYLADLEGTIATRAVRDPRDVQGRRGRGRTAGATGADHQGGQRRSRSSSTSASASRPAPRSSPGSPAAGFHRHARILAPTRTPPTPGVTADQERRFVPRRFGGGTEVTLDQFLERVCLVSGTGCRPSSSGGPAWRLPAPMPSAILPPISPHEIALDALYAPSRWSSPLAR